VYGAAAVDTSVSGASADGTKTSSPSSFSSSSAAVIGGVAAAVVAVGVAVGALVFRKRAATRASRGDADYLEEGLTIKTTTAAGSHYVDMNQIQ